MQQPPAEPGEATDPEAQPTPPPPPAWTEEEWAALFEPAPTASSPEPPSDDSPDEPEVDLQSPPTLPPDTLPELVTDALTDSDTPSETESPFSPTTAGQYERHYTLTGRGGGYEYYLDVTVSATFGTSVLVPAGEEQIPGEQGTVSYTAWLTDQGSLVYDYSNTESFTAPLPVDGPSGLFGQPYAAAAVPGLGWSNFFSVSAAAWDYQSWTDSATYDVTGTSRDPSGLIVFFANHYGQSSWRTTTRTWTDGAEPGAGTEVVHAEWGGGHRKDMTRSDLATNVAETAQYDVDGYPTDLLQTPGEGTKYLKHVFDARQYSGTETTTRIFAGQGELSSSTTSHHSAYDGIDGERLYAKDAVKVGDRTNADDPSEHRLSWLRDYQGMGSYGGSHDSELSSAGLAGLQNLLTQDLDDVSITDLTPISVYGYSGTVTTVWYAGGQVLVDRLELTDDYFEKEGDFQIEGTSKFSRDTNGVTGVLNNRETREQSYDDHGRLAVDKQTYRHQYDSGLRITSLDRAEFKQTVKDADGNTLGEVKGNERSQTSATSRVDGVRAGVVNLLDQSGSVDEHDHSSASTASNFYHTATFTTSDGVARLTTTAFSVGSESLTTSANAKGNYNTEGKQIDGTSFRHSDGTGKEVGWVWTARQPKDAPTFRSLTTFDDTSTINETIDLSFGSGGQANGTIKIDNSDTATEQTTSTLVGDLKLSDGTSTFNDKYFVKLATIATTHVDLTLALDQPTGNVTEAVTTTLTHDDTVDQTTARDNGKLNAKVGATDKGSVANSETIATYFGSEPPQTIRWFVSTKTNDATATTTASGRLTDDAGHVGQWRLTVNFNSSIDNRVAGSSTLESDGWSKPTPDFRVDETTTQFVTFHQFDTGVGSPATEPGFTDVKQHFIDSTHSTHKVVFLQGTPGDYSYKLQNYDSQWRQESRNRVWSNPAGDDAGTSSSREVSKRLSDDVHEGTFYQGRREETKMFFQRRTETAFQTDVQGSRGPNVRSYEVHTRNHNLHDELRSGTLANWTGYREVAHSSRTWWRRDSSDTLFPESGGNEHDRGFHERTPLAWPLPDTTIGDVLWDDFSHDPAVQWMSRYWPEVVRIGVGIIDVGGGLFFTFGTGGMAAIPGIGLILAGVDQVYTGVANIATGYQTLSGLELGGYLTARGLLGVDEQTAQVVGLWTGAIPTLTFWYTGGLLAEAEALARATRSGASISKRVGEWPNTGLARFDQKAIESSAWRGWTANLERRGIRVVPNPDLPAGNPGNYIPGTRVLEYNPETYRYIDLLHESRHIGQFERAAAKGLDLQAPFRSARLYGWLEKGALDYEMKLAHRFNFSAAYRGAIQDSLEQFWKAGFRKKYVFSPSVRSELDQWWK